VLSGSGRTRAIWLTHGHHGGTVQPITPAADQIEAATLACKALPGSPVLARLDLLSFDGAPVVGEAEVIDPDLYTRFSQRAAGQVADALISVRT
jgi:hypothetical protein